MPDKSIRRGSDETEKSQLKKFLARKIFPYEKSDTKNIQMMRRISFDTKGLAKGREKETKNSTILNQYWQELEYMSH